LPLIQSSDLPDLPVLIMFSLLYIDDEPGLLELGQLFLESTGDFTVTTALSADAGLACLAQHDFDAIISDYQMPGMDGISLLKNVRKSFGSIPFILFTGRGREEVVIEAINNGVDFYLQKGGDPKSQFAELAHKIRQAVNRRRAEIALSDSEKRLADLINFLPDATFAIDIHGIVIAWNRAMERMTSVRSDDVLGKGDYEYALPFYRERRPLLINLVLEEDTGIAAKYPFVKKEGRTLFSEITIPHFNDGRGAALWFTASPLYDKKGDVVGAIESIRDITERKRAEESLVSANREYTNLLDQIQDVYYRTDTGGRLVRASKSWATLLGYDDITECIGKSIADDFYVRPHDRKPLLDEIYRNGKVTGYEVWLKKKDGTPILVEASSHLYFDPAGMIIGIEGTFRDITGRKKAEEELQAANEQLVASEEELRAQYDELAESEKRIRLSETRLTFMLGFYEYAQKGEKELLEYAIEGAGIVTGSSLGYLAFLNDDESELSMYAWSKNAMAECSMRQKPVVYQTEKTGLWGEAVRQRRPVITNNYAAPNPAKKGYPEGHPRIIRHMNVPVIDDGHIVLVAGVANKPSDYTENDTNELLLLMQGLWTIIKRRRVEEEQRLLKISVDQSADEIFWMDFDGNILYVNEAACRINGYPRNEFLRMKIFDLNPDLTPAIWDGSVTDLRQRKTQLITTRHKRKDGTVADVEIMAVYVNRDGEEFSFAYVRDITGRKRAETELRAAYERVTAAEEELREQYEELEESELRARESDERLQLALEGGGLGTWNWNVQTGEVTFNQRWAEMLGYRLEELEPHVRSWERLVHPDDMPQVQHALTAHLEGRTAAYECEHRLRHKDGSWVWVLDKGKVIRRDAEGRPLLAAGTHLDITVRMKALEELQMVKISVDQSSDEVFWMDFDGNILYVNEAACRITGYSRDEFLTMKIFELDPDFPSEVWEASVADLRRRKTQHIITRHRRKDGVIIDVEIIAVYVRRDGQEYSFAFVRDITDRKRAETELQTAYEQVAAAEEELREQYEELAAAQTTLSTQRQQLEEIASTVPGVVYQFYVRADGSTGMYFVSSRAGEIFGLGPDLKEFFPVFSSGVHPDDRARFLASIDDVVKRTADWNFEGRFIKPSGEIIWFEGVSSPVARGNELVFTGVLLDITERKKMEEAVRESEERYRSLVELSPDAVVVHRGGKVLYANPEALRLVGAKRNEDIIGMEVLSFIHPDDRAMAREDFRLLFEEGKIIPLKEERLVRMDGDPFTVEVTATPIQYQGNLSGLVVFRDLTGRKRTEEALFSSQQMLQAVLDSIPQRVFWKDRNSVFLGCNKPLALDAGFSEPAEIVGKTDYDHASHATADLYRADDRLVMETGEPRINFEEPQIRPDGSPAWLRTTKVPLRNKEGAIIGVLGTYEDITERKRAEAALVESEERYRTLVESSFDGIAIHQDGILVYVNRTAARLLGSEDPGVFIGKPAIDIVAPAFRAQIAARVQQAPDSIQELIQEQFLRIDGTAIDVDVTTTPCMWKGKTAAYVTFRDISAQMHAEEALRESEEKYRMLVEHSRDGVFIVQEGRLVFYNKALVGLTGYTAEDLNNRPLADLIAPEDREMVIARARDRAGGKQVPDLYELSLLHKDSVSKTRVRIRAGLGTYKGRPASIGTFYDITEDRKREDALRESEEKFRALVETTSDFIWEVDADGAYTYVSPQVKGILGYEPEELLGKTPFEIMPVGEADRVVKEYRRCLDSRLPIVALENKALRKDGAVVIFETSGIVRLAKDGSYLGYRGIDRDITARKLTEEALHEKTEELNQYFMTSLDLFCIADKDGYFRRLNPEWEKSLGYTIASLEGKRFLDFVHPDDLPATLATLADLSSQKEVLNFTNRYRHKDGTYRWIEWRSFPHGNLIFAAARDITARHDAVERTQRISALKQDLLRNAPLEEKLKRITDGIVDIFSADFARIWMAGSGDLCEKGCIHAPVSDGPHTCRNRLSCLHLIVSSGRYTHTDGGHRRVPFGAYKIGRIATGDEAQFVTNNVIHDPRVHDHSWAESLGLVSFAGFRLVSPEGKPIGVLAFFSRHTIPPEVMDDLDDFATTTSQVIQTGIAEHAQQEREEWGRTILNTAQAGIILVDAMTHRILDANRKALDLIGLPRDSVISAVCHRFICPAEEGKCPVTDCGQVVDTSERILFTAAGGRIPVLKTVVPASLGGRDVLVESFVDISDQKRSETAIREANRKLNLLNSITRHDIRNQLMVAHGYTQLAALNKPDPVVADFLAKISTSVQIIQHQIEFTKEYQELGVHAPAWFSLAEVILSVRPEKIALHNSCGAVEIFADPMIDKVFFNLFDNAVKHGVEATAVTVGCKEREDNLVITFADNGTGIPPAEKQKIFEKGYGKNTGLGLFLVREILAITGITIHETGTQGQGAVFEITVPEGAYRNVE
jgi:PAS domain S-box-containing protein